MTSRSIWPANAPAISSGVRSRASSAVPIETTSNEPAIGIAPRGPSRASSARQRRDEEQGAFARVEERVAWRYLSTGSPAAGEAAGLSACCEHHRLYEPVGGSATAATRRRPLYAPKASQRRDSRRRRYRRELRTA